VQVLFEPLPASVEHIKSGRLHALAVTTAQRSEALPNLPTVSEFVAGYEASGWNGLCAPKNTSVGIVEKLHGAVQSTLADPKIRAQLAGLGATTLAGSPAEFSKRIAAETEKWANVIRAANIKLG
jgi:tripartite-type tricarboxylate transporter receptor subunit TctC